MRIKETKVYQYAELSDAAKEKARDWYRQGQCDDSFWHESITDDALQVFKACGFTLNMTRNRQPCVPELWFSGFSSQGDGASFGATWSASDVNTAQLRKEWPAVSGSAGNIHAHAVMDAAIALAAKYPQGAGSTSPSHHGHCQRDTDFDPNDGNGEPDEDAIDAFADLCRDIAHWYYRALEREYEYQNSDDVVAENIEANEYEFTEDGRRV